MTVSNAHLRTVFLILLALTVLKFTKPIAAPILLAAAIGVVLSPLLDAAAQARVPAVVTAVVATVTACLAIFGGVLLLAPIVEEALAQVPAAIDTISRSLDWLTQFGREIEQVSQEVSAAIGAADNQGQPAEAPLPSLIDAALVAPQIGAQALIFLGTFFFFTLTRYELYRWAAGVFAENGHREEAYDMMRVADRSVSRYFVTITAMNALLGCAVAFGLYLFDFEAPAVWGFIAFLLNYILYLGPILFGLTLLLVGHLEFSGLVAFGPMLMFFALNLLEGYVLTPSLVGRRLSISPLLVFLTLTVGLWIWGVTGGLVALPVLVWMLAATGTLRLSVENEVNYQMKAAE